MISIECQPAVIPSLHERLQLIRQEPVAAEQFGMLCGWMYWGLPPGAEQNPVESFNTLVHFAADEASSSSLLVRAQALELAYSFSSSINELADERMQLSALVNVSSRNHECAKVPALASTSEEHRHSRRYGIAAARLAQVEGIPFDMVYPDWHQNSFDSLLMSNFNPVAAFGILDGLSLLGDAQPKISPFTKLVPLAVEIQEKLNMDSFALDGQDAKRLYDIGRLARLVDFGAHYGLQIEQFLQNTVEPERYIEVLNNLYDNAALLKEIFPKDYQEGVEQGARELVADALYGICSYIQQGEACDAELPLMNGGSLPLHLEKGEALAVLERLSSAMKQLHEVATDTNLRTILVNKGANFQIYRLVTPQKANVSVYIRSLGVDAAYDRRLEYGRPGEGVEASISFVVDPTLPDDRFLEVGKHAGEEPDGRVSIRLDREGVTPWFRDSKDVRRNPAVEQGTVSLDIGSVIGGDKWLGTWVGRFLAMGNFLRSKSQGTQTHLNHVAHQFTNQQGTATHFAQAAQELGAVFAARVMNVSEIARRFTGVAAVRAMQ